MIFFLLPFIINPFGMIVSWLPALYLGSWPIIIQTMGRETLLTHALILIMFIVTCDITRQTMFKLVGFDLLSFPLSIALLATLATERGSLFLSLVRPIFSGLLVAVEPIFLLIEIYLVSDMIKSFNRWISKMSNVREDDPHDLSSWDQPLARGSIVARTFVILITIFSYIGAYMIIQESRSLLNNGDTPIQFNHAIAMLLTLQIIALSATIYKEEGIISESGLISLAAAIPIYIAAWSFYHLKETKSIKSSSGWYSPLQLLGMGQSQEESAHKGASTALFGHQLPSSAFEDSLNQLGPIDELSKQMLVSSVHKLIMVINSLLGLSMDKVAKYYFGPDFWYVLAGRMACVAWWALIWSRASGTSDEQSSQRLAISQGLLFIAALIYQPLSSLTPPSQEARAHQPEESLPARARRLERAFTRHLAISRRTFVKLLLVLAYTQMLIQQMDNLDQLSSDPNHLLASQRPTTSCCHQQQAEPEPNPLTNWMACVWSSARACSGAQPADARHWPRALLDVGLQLLNQLADMAKHLYLRITDYEALLQWFWALWLARWRSPIVQRLAQSALVQLYYTGSLLAFQQ